MGKRVLFYVSGHGFGHAVRTAEIVRALAARGTVDEIHVRTTAPAHLFEGSAGVPVRVSGTAIDAGAVEESPLTINARRTVERAASLLENRERILAEELNTLRGAGIGLIVADIPFLAGEVGAAAGVPCLACGNFLWSWIYEPYADLQPELSHVLEQVREGYRRMQLWLRMPFGHPSDIIREVRDVPLVARKPQQSPPEVLRALGLEPEGSRPRVLLGMRGGMPPDLVAAAAAGCPEILFLEPSAEPGSSHDNLRRIRLAEGLTFTDVLNACDAIVSKLGYGVVAECISTGTAILWPRRAGFREDEITCVEAPLCLRSREIPLADYQAGRWAAHLEALLRMAAPPGKMRTDGAEVCAEIIELGLR